MSKRYKAAITVIFSIFITLSMTGCFAGERVYGYDDPAGFFWGIWHGWIAPVSLIAMLFSDTIIMFEIHNTGFGYNAGFYMAVISGFGGIALFRRRR